MKKVFTLLLAAVFSFGLTEAFSQQSITVFVFEDQNANGVFDGADVGIAGLSNTDLLLWLDDGDGVPGTGTDISIQYDNDAGDGNYTWNMAFAPAGLADGDYIVQYMDLSATNYISPLGAGSQVDRDIDGDGNLSTGYSPVIALSGMMMYTGTDMGLFAVGSIETYMWSEANGDGFQDDATDIPANTIELYDSGGALASDIFGTSPVVPTGGPGNYLFENLPPGDYYIEYTTPATPGGSVGPYYPTIFNADGDDSAFDGDMDSDIQQAPSPHQTRVLSLTSGATLSNADAGFFLPGVVQTTIFHDINGNGIQDGGVEVGIDGLADGTFTLIDESTGAPALDAYGNPVVWVDLGGGEYQWQNLVPSMYHVEYVQTFMSGGETFYATQFMQGGDNTLDSDADPNNGYISGSFMVTADQTIEDIDAGFYVPALVRTFVWEDANGDGEQDGAGPPAEDGITGEGGNFQLWDNITMAQALDANGIPLVSNEMGAAGEYVFELVPPGEYFIQYVLPAPPAANPFVVTLKDVGTTSDDLDSDVERDALSPTYLQSNTFTLISQDVEEDVDAGFFVPATITTFVWNDANGDGEQDGAGPPNEPGITGEGSNFQLWDNITMMQALDVQSMPIVSNEMGAPGEYVFELVPPGEYFIQFVLPTPPGVDPYVVTLKDVGTTSDDLDSDVEPDMLSPTYLQSNTFTVISQEEEEEVDGGFLLPAKITVYTWEDLNGDGINDPGEPAITGQEGLPIAILLENDGITPANDILGNPALLTAGMNAGEYEFLNLSPGEYIVQFAIPPPPGGTPYYLTRFDSDGDNTDGGDGNTDSDADPTLMNQSYIIELSSEENHENVDAGYYVPGIVGDRVFCDKDGNGIFDGVDLDEGVANIQVTMFNTDPLIGEDPLLDANGIPMTMMTDGTGNYLFTNVPPGENHQIRFEAPMGFEFTDPNVGGDDTVDSDAIPTANPMIAETMPFELLSQEEMEEAMRNDCGMFQLITIQGRVWLDDIPSDGVYMGEAGANGVTVRLINDEGGVVETSITFGGGIYLFEDIRPGIYTIDVPSPNFESGQPLNGTKSCTPDGDPITNENDDNGIGDSAPASTVPFTLLSGCNPATPPTVSYIDFCFTFDCEQENALALRTCEDAAVAPICDLPTLEGFCSRMFNTDSGGDQPTPLCPGQANTAAHNISWFGFIAGAGNYSVIIDPFACSGSSGDEGVQIGIYTSCDFDDAVFCNGACNLNSVTVPSTNLVPGEVYYIFIDGCNSSVCSYTIDVTDGYDPPPMFAADDLCVGNNASSADCNDPEVCIDTDIDFVLTGLELELEYTWSVTSTGSGVYQGDPAPETTEPTISLSFDEVGTYVVCVESATNGCQFWSNPARCRNVTVVELTNEVFPDVDICANELDQFDIAVFDALDPNMDGTLGWQAGPQSWTFGINEFDVVLPNGCTYTQSFEINSIPLPATEEVIIVLCEEEFPFTYNGEIYEINQFPFGTGILIFDNILLDEPASTGCDSMINLELNLIQLEGEYLDIICDENGIQLGFDPLPVPFAWSVMYEWEGPAGMLTFNNDNDGNDLTATADQGDGIYWIVATVSIELDDGSIKTCVIRQPDLVVSMDDFQPDEPTLSGDLNICEGELVTYTASSTTPGATFAWTVPNGVTIDVLGTSDEIAEIVWTTQGNVDISVEVITGCGSATTTLGVTLIPPPVAEISVTSPVCIDSISTISFVGDTSIIASYIWSYDGGVVSNGSGQDAGPHEVSWGTAGVKYINMTYTDMNGCVSTTALDSVTVEAPIAPPMVTCDLAAAEANEVVFTWNDIPGLVYSFEITNPATDYTGTDLVGNVLTVTGVPNSTTITMILTSLTGTACNTIVSLPASCTAQDCTPAEVQVLPAIDTLCANEATLTQQITFVLDPAPDPAMPGTIAYSGPGVDMTTGIFDASVAGVGTHPITITYTAEDGCIGVGDTTITILAVPNPSFVIAEDTICSNDMAMFTYTGTGTAGNFTWTFDGGTSTQSGIGPVQNVSWTTGGLKTVTVALEDLNGCTSDVFSSTVFVDELIDIPLPLCSPDLAGVGEVVFTWPDNPDVTYTVEIISDPAVYTDSILVGNMLTVTGVAEGVPISIILTTDTGNSCGILTSPILACEPGACTEPVVVISVDNPSVCEDGPNEMQQINLVSIIPPQDPADPGTIVYGGLGVNSVTGIFDGNASGPGVHVVSVTYTDPSGCEGVGTTEITVLPKPDADFTADATDICISDAITFTYSGGDDVDDYIWNFGDAVMPIEGGANPTVRWESAGMKTVSLTVIQDGCESDPFTMMINVQELLVAPIVSCINQDADGITFSWTPTAGATGYSIDISYPGFNNTETQTGTTIEIMVPSFTEVTIVVTPIVDASVLCPVVPSEPESCIAVDCPDFTFTNLTTDTIVCLDGNTSPILLEYTVVNDDTGLDVVGTVLYTGQNIDSGSNTFDPTGLTPGMYTVEVDFTETATGCKIPGLITFTLLEQPISTFTISDADVCVDGVVTVVFTGSGLGSSAPNWNVSGGTIVATAVPNEYEWTFTSDGSFTINLDVVNDICTDSATEQTVTVNTPQEIGDVMCTSGDMGEIVITWDAVSCAVDYTIFVDGVETATVTDLTYTAEGLAEGAHDFTVEATSSCACEIVAGTNSGECLALGCPVQTATLSAPTMEWCQAGDDLTPVSIDVAYTGTDGTLGSITWTGGNDDGTFDPAGLAVGDYTVSFSYMEPDCQEVTAEIVFTILGQPEANPMPDNPSCYTDLEGFVSFDPMGGLAPYMILVDGVDAPAEGIVIGLGGHDVEIIDANGCSAITSFSVIAPDPLALTELDIDGDMSIILNSTETYSIDPSVLGGVSVDSLIWTSADGTVLCSGPDCLSITQQFTGDDEITVVVVYNSGCEVETTFEVITQEITIIDITNIMSVNGDGTNDEFVIFTNSDKVIFNSVKIYDRWGNLVGSDDGWVGPGSHTVWDGRFGSTDVVPGVYIYTMSYIDDGVPKRRTGDITVVR